MAEKQRTEGTSAPTLGEAAGLVTKAEHDAVVAELAAAEEDAHEKAGQLADLADALFGDEERALRRGYEGVLARVMDLLRVEAAAPGLQDALREAVATKDLAVREAVAAKGRALELQRENDRLRLDRTELAQEVEELRAKVTAHWEDLKAARFQVDKGHRVVERLERELAATMARAAVTPGALEHEEGT